MQLAIIVQLLLPVTGAARQISGKIGVAASLIVLDPFLILPRFFEVTKVNRFLLYDCLRTHEPPCIRFPAGTGSIQHRDGSHYLNFPVFSSCGVAGRNRVVPTLCLTMTSQVLGGGPSFNLISISYHVGELILPSTISCGGGRARYDFVMPAKSNKEKQHPDLEEGEINDLSGAAQGSQTQELNRGGDVRATSGKERGEAGSIVQLCTNGMEVLPSGEGASGQGREQEKHPPPPLVAAVGVEAMAPCPRMGSFVIVFDE